MISFIFSPESIATPSGLASACEEARRFVEKYVPGDHRPGACSYFWQPAPGYPAGCRCAIGYLKTAIAGSLKGAPERGNTRLIEDALYGGGTLLGAFENGFDRGIQGLPLPDYTERLEWRRAGLEWRRAGYELGRKWADELLNTPPSPPPQP